MRLHRFIGDFDLTSPEVVITEDGLVHQIRRVLRMEEDDELLLADGNGRQARCRITAITPQAITASVEEVSVLATEPSVRVTLYCSLLRRENFEWVVQKATECGVARIVPIITERTVKFGGKRERFALIAREAAEQSGRGVIPDVADAISFREALGEATRSGRAIFFDADGLPAHHALAGMSSGGMVALFIGPEGGWSAGEGEAARAAGLSVASLGALTLRAETAAIVATYLTAHAAGVYTG